jgi:hypothetical protein
VWNVTEVAFNPSVVVYLEILISNATIFFSSDTEVPHNLFVSRQPKYLQALSNTNSPNYSLVLIIIEITDTSILQQKVIR